MRLTTLIVPVDDSAESLKAANYAAAMAKGFGAELVLVHCEPAVSLRLGRPNADEAEARRRAAAEDVLAPYRLMCAEYEVPCRELALEGPSAETIVDAARAEKADMVVIGSRGKTDIEALAVGSVTHTLLTMAPCPVLVVR